jgi:hypothetical protein
MKPYVFAVAVLAAIAVTPCFAQFPGDRNGKGINLPGTLNLVDKPPSVTPVEFLTVTIRQLHGGYRFDAQPNHDGNFTLENVPLGRYSLNLPFPGRIQVLAIGSKSLMPDEFELTAGDSGPLRIVVSLKTSVLSVEISGIPDTHPNVVAMVSPADPYLMPPEAGILNPVSGHQTQFRYLTPGSYTLFVVDAVFKMALTSSAVRDALKNKSTAVQVRDEGETKVTATYVTPDAVRQAITAARWLDPAKLFPEHVFHTMTPPRLGFAFDGKCSTWLY